jgi:hypothetical protein
MTTTLQIANNHPIVRFDNDLFIYVYGNKRSLVFQFPSSIIMLKKKKSPRKKKSLSQQKNTRGTTINARDTFRLLDLIKAILPNGKDDWIKVCDQYNNYGDIEVKQNLDSLRNKYNTLVSKIPLTGCAKMPPEIRRAKYISQLIAHTHDYSGNDENVAADEEYNEESEEAVSEEDDEDDKEVEDDGGNNNNKVSNDAEGTLDDESQCTFGIICHRNQHDDDAEQNISTNQKKKHLQKGNQMTTCPQFPAR